MSTSGKVESWLAEAGRSEEERRYYSHSQRVYAAFAPFYDAVTFPVRRLRRAVARAIGPVPGSRVLDVCTGTGAQAFALAGSAGEVVGLDHSEAMLRVARRKDRRPNVRFVRADAALLPFGDRTFDLACISFALHEMPSSVRERVVHEMARVVRPGGSIVVVDYGLPRNRLASSLAYRVIRMYERDHFADFVRSDLDALLAGAGIRVTGRRPALLGLVRIVIGSRDERRS